MSNAPHSALDTFLGASPLRRRRHWLSVLVLLLALVAVVALFQRFLVGTDSPYYTAPVARGDITPLLSLRGTLHGEGEVTVAAAQEGTITAVPGPGEGLVADGQDLAAMDTAPLQRALAQDMTQARVANDAQARAALTARAARVRLDRYEGVWRRSAGRVPSLNEMEGAREDLRRAELDMQTAQDQRDLAQQQVADDRARLAAAVARAPFAGYVVARLVRPGQAVHAGQPLFTLSAHPDRLSVAVPMDAGQAARIAPGGEAGVLIDGMPDDVHPAKLVRIEPAAGGGRVGVFALNPQTDADGKPVAPPAALVPGLSATVDIALADRQDVLLVPNAALAFAPSGGARRSGARVFVLGDDGAPRRVAVAIGASDGKHTEVMATGLTPGAQVIIGWRTTAGAASGASVDTHRKP